MSNSDYFRALAADLDAIVARMKATDPTSKPEWEAIGSLESAARRVFDAAAWTARAEDDAPAVVITSENEADREWDKTFDDPTGFPFESSTTVDDGEAFTITIRGRVTGAGDVRTLVDELAVRALVQVAEPDWDDIDNPDLDGLTVEHVTHEATT